MSNNYTIANAPAYGKLRKTNYWETVDVVNNSLSALFSKYREIEVAIDDSFGKPLTLDLYMYESEVRYRNELLSVWLASRGSKALAAVAGYPTYVTASVPYIPINYVAGTVAVAMTGKHPSYSTEGTDANDVIIDLNGNTPSGLHEHSLFSVNGFYFRTTYHDYGVRLLHAGDAIRASRRFESGFLSFNDVGSVKQLPITESMVHKLDDTKSLWDRITIDANYPLYGKTVGLVLGGYLHLLDGVVRVIGDETVTVSVRNLNLMERVIQSKETLDLSFFEMDDLENNSVVKLAKSEEAILKYLTSKYSFLVVIDNPDLMLDQTGVSQSAMVGDYIVPYGVVPGLLKDNYGRVIDYWPMADCGLWTLKTSYLGNPSILFTQSGWHELTRFNSAREGRLLTLPKELKMCTYKARVK